MAPGTWERKNLRIYSFLSQLTTYLIIVYLVRYIIRLLILRGETNIRVLDLHPPQPDIASHSAVTFIRTDVTNLKSVRDGLTQPFSDILGSADVIYHTAALIRFWERANYTWDISHDVNVQGTANVLSVAKKLPNAILIYTSTSDAAIPCAKFLRLGFDYKTRPWHKATISDEDTPLGTTQGSESCYTRTKILAERLVIGANGWNGLKTGIIRPGLYVQYYPKFELHNWCILSTIIGPNDRLLTSTLTMARVPIFDQLWSHTNVCVWDVAAAHLLHEDALQRIPEEASGKAFLVTGKDPAWRLRDTRNAIKVGSYQFVVWPAQSIPFR